MQRRLEFVGGSSAKFWEIAVTNTEVAVPFGRLGTEGQRQTKTFDHPEQAERHAAGLLRQKLAKGYVTAT